MLDKLKEKNNVISYQELKVGIMKHIGSEKRAIDGSLNLLKELKLIKDKGNGEVKIL